MSPGKLRMLYTGARRYSSTSTDGDLRVYASRHRDAMGVHLGLVHWGETERTVAVRIAETGETALDLELTVPAVSVTSLEIPEAGAPRARTLWPRPDGSVPRTRVRRGALRLVRRVQARWLRVFTPRPKSTPGCISRATDLPGPRFEEVVASHQAGADTRQSSHSKAISHGRHKTKLLVNIRYSM